MTVGDHSAGGRWSKSFNCILEGFTDAERLAAGKI
jgi:hypothetical protein